MSPVSLLRNMRRPRGAKAKPKRRGNQRCKLCGGTTSRQKVVGEDMCIQCYQKADSLSSCDGKHRYARQTEAQMKADELNSQAVLRLSESVPYYCEKHRGYHVGHARSLEERQARGKMLREIYRKVSP